MGTTAVTTTTASSNQNPSTINTDNMSTMRDKVETSLSLTNKKMIASLVDCRVTICNLPNLEQFNMTRRPMTTNGTTTTTSSTSSNSSTNGCMSILDSSASSSQSDGVGSKQTDET